MNKYQKVIIDTEEFNYDNWVDTFDAQVSLVYALQKTGFLGTDYVLPSLRKSEEDKLQSAKKYLETISENMGITNGSKMEVINSKEILLKKAKDSQSDLIVLSKNKKNFDSFFKKILRSLPCDVLVIKE